MTHRLASFGALAASSLLAASLHVGLEKPTRAEPVAAGACTDSLGSHTPTPGPNLRFGTTVAGKVFAPHPDVPEDARTVPAAVELASGKEFVARVNRVLFSGGAEAIAAAAERARRYSAAGLKIDFQLRYDSPEAQPEAFGDWVGALVRRVAPDPNVVTVQVTNEANLVGAQDNSDGARPGILEAIAAGVLAADREAKRASNRGLHVGFSWYYEHGPDEDTFWSGLDAALTPAARAALDWVGLSTYPGTYWPPVTPPGTEGLLVVDALATLRCHMRAIALPDSLPIRISEIGWPTDAARGEALQALALEKMVSAVHEYRGTFNVTDFSWFTLWDADVLPLSKESHYGLLRPDMSPKPSFDIYAQLVRELGR